MVLYCTASTHECLHEQLSMSREALLNSEGNLARVSQEVDALLFKIHDLEVKLQESQDIVECLRQDQASWLKRMAALAVLFVFFCLVCVSLS